MEIYKSRKRHTYKFLKYIVFIYIVLLVLHPVSVAYIGFVFEANEASSIALFNDENNDRVNISNNVFPSRVFVASSVLRYILYYTRITSTASLLQNDVVLVDVKDFYTSGSTQGNMFIKKLLNIITLGIVSTEPYYALQKIVAIEGDIVEYSNNVIYSINGDERQSTQSAAIPFLDDIKKIELKEGEYFIESPTLEGKIYGIDSKVVGPISSDKIIGKVIIVFSN